MMHPADPRWNHPPPLFGNAIDLLGVARAEGFQFDNHPTPGAMVVFGSAYGVFGHIGTVRAVQGDRYEVVEQNFLDFNSNIEPHWQTFDLRSVAWPDAAVVGSSWRHRSADGGPPSQGRGDGATRTADYRSTAWCQLRLLRRTAHKADGWRLQVRAVPTWAGQGSHRGRLESLRSAGRGLARSRPRA
jgi:surface antigen